MFGVVPDARPPLMTVRRIRSAPRSPMSPLRIVTKPLALKSAHGLPAAPKTIAHLNHCSATQDFGISLEFRSKFANRGHRDSSDELLYRLSYLGGNPILLEMRAAGAARNGAMVSRCTCGTARDVLRAEHD